MLLHAPARVRARDDTWLIELCERTASALRATRETLLPNVYDVVGKEEFYDAYRPCLGGFNGLKFVGIGVEGERGGGDGVAGSAHGGDVAEGAAAAAPADGGSEDDDVRVTREVTLVGPSAGQTAILMLIDAVLGVSHGTQTASFRQAMLGYLPLKHAALVRDVTAQIAEGGSVRDAATRAGEASPLARAHADALARLAAVRAFHMGMATSFLRAALKGTGDSDFRSLLDEALRSTRAAAAKS
eukprot:6404771-Prymnesium_polylepis.1